MKHIFFSTIILILCLSSCTTSMSPSQVNNTLPGLTTAKYYNQLQAIEAKKDNKCKLIAKDRTYLASIGFMPKDDLKNAAKGIDEWVIIDGPMQTFY
ncbi:MULTISPECIES: hypothetical protein [Mesonia]|uniref:Uncharacterized protein n=1 Tax=Mesonia oceanica TaxID=2687242 RepID=A0AC61Y7E9_9FLAO|nr:MULTISPECIES: hypothetical protein [Mesonia]VVV00402.1 hypothetical protein FVB9532_01672 [Mesonia oceanica]